MDRVRAQSAESLLQQAGYSATTLPPKQHAAGSTMRVGRHFVCVLQYVVLVSYRTLVSCVDCVYRSLRSVTEDTL